MTDAQSFYLLLAIFYFIECLASAPSGSQAFVSKGAGAKRWRIRRVAFPVHGFRKDIFLTPIFPWPGMLVMPKFQAISEPLAPMALRHLGKRIQLLTNSTAPLRSTGLLIFLHFFLLLPVCYYFYARTPVVLFALVYGYLLCVLAAARFYALHQRYFPTLKEERFKNTIYTAFLPWHAMRAADVIALRLSAGWNPHVLMATDPSALSNKRQLRRAWNEAALHPEVRPGRDELASLFDQAGLDLEAFTAPPELSHDEAYCPLCETIYVEGTSQCANCPEVALVPAQR